MTEKGPPFDGKKIEDMTLEEAKAEYDYWEKKVQLAKAWGASLAAANEFRTAARRRIMQLERSS